MADQLGCTAILRDNHPQALDISPGVAWHELAVRIRACLMLLC